MSRRFLEFLLSITLLALPACVRSSSTQIPGPATQPVLSQATAIPAPTTQLAVMQTPSTTPETSSSQLISPTTGPTFTPAEAISTGLPVQVSQMLAIMPLEAGTSWVYTDEAYSGDGKIIWRVVDTITDNLVRPPLFAARIQREVTLMSGAPSAGFINPPLNAVYWYLVRGNQIYRQDVDLPAGLKWDGLDGLTLEFVLPINSKTACWYPDPGQRQSASASVTPAAGSPGCRSAGAATTLKFPAGTLDNCHLLVTSYNNGSEKMTFCDGVGIAERSFDHYGSAYGDHFILTGYLAQTP